MMSFDHPMFNLVWQIALCAGLTFILFRFFAKLGTSAKLKDSANRWSKNAKPTIGGIIFLIAFLCAMIPILIAHNYNSEVLIVVCCGVFSFALGFWDDLKRISVRAKLGGQLLIAAMFAANRILVGQNSHVDFHFELNMIWHVGFVIFLVVALMNSVNMLDNMDGVASIAAIPVMLVPFVLNGDQEQMSISFWLFSGLFGFLSFNWPSSKVFMGDSGSLLLGFVAAWLVLKSQHNMAFNASDNSLLLFSIILICSCGLFIVDTMVVVINRIRHGVSPATGGRDHTTHNLVYLGCSDKMVARIFVLLAIMQLLLFVFFVWTCNMDSIRHLKQFAIALVFGYFFLLFLTMFLITIRNLRKGKFNYSR